MITKDGVKPILKWAGGKRQLHRVLTQNLPDKFCSYYEPFFGGGALFFSLYNLGTSRKCFLSDINSDLCTLYLLIRDDVNLIIESVNEVFSRYGNSRDGYYMARDRFNRSSNALERSALLIYLNRHCYNGLYRVNSAGDFNVPFGRYRNVGMPHPDLFHSVSMALKNCRIAISDFQDAVNAAGTGDLVYFDPPYTPVSSTASFTDYTSGGFDKLEQIRLRSVFVGLDRRGAFLIESNSDTEFIRELYSDYKIIEVTSRRSINSVATRRKGSAELIIKNF